jgi:hypothetical protein
VRVIQGGRRARLALEPQQMFFGGRQRRRQQLDRHVAAEFLIVRLIHLAHAAGAERRDDFEAAGNPETSGEWHDGDYDRRRMVCASDGRAAVSASAG